MRRPVLSARPVRRQQNKNVARLLLIGCVRHHAGMLARTTRGLRAEIREDLGYGSLCVSLSVLVHGALRTVHGALRTRHAHACTHQHACVPSGTKACESMTQGLCLKTVTPPIKVGSAPHLCKRGLRTQQSMGKAKASVVTPARVMPVN